MNRVYENKTANETADPDDLHTKQESSHKAYRKRSSVPLWERVLLSLNEAAEYTGLGIQKLRKISDDDDCSFVLWVGNKRMFKRRKLQEYLEEQTSI